MTQNKNLSPLRPSEQLQTPETEETNPLQHFGIFFKAESFVVFVFFPVKDQRVGLMRELSG